jgi:hypothetical protein
MTTQMVPESTSDYPLQAASFGKDEGHRCNGMILREEIPGCDRMELVDRILTAQFKVGYAFE